jgi:hypothetical protein
MPAQSPFNRRNFLIGATMATAALAIGPTARASAAGPPADGSTGSADGVDLHWLDGAPAATGGATWGVPWPKGALAKSTTFAVRDSDGGDVPVQSWPLAYWPDGTLKWTGHAVTSAAVAGGYRLAPGTPATPRQPVTATSSRGEIRLANGVVDVRIARSGPVAIRSITRGSRITAHDGRLVLLLQDEPEDDLNPKRTNWTGVVESARITQCGPVRAVVEISGSYRRDDGANHGRGAHAILPWVLRVYLGAGDESMRLVHHFTWNADTSRDFVRGLGLELAVPMGDEPHNRHIRFGTASGGVWGEPVRVLTGLRRDPGAPVRAAQVAGTVTPRVSQWAQPVQSEYEQLAVWNDFTLFQGSPDHFSVWKRTSSAGSWIKHAGHGDRASGYGYAGGVSGGLGFGMRDFWQRFPRALDIRAAGTGTGTVTLWSWSPLAPRSAPHWRIRSPVMSPSTASRSTSGSGTGSGTTET